MTNITVVKFDGNKVEFTSPLGNGVAVWCGEPPEVSGSYNVEFDVDDIFKWGLNINDVCQETSEIKVDGDGMLFVSQVISYESDGVLTVSLGGQIIFLDVEYYPGGSKFVSFSTAIENISLYPFEV
ncbi:hypothetical protein CIW69_04655 [Enterobacter cloacae]|nr:hypothetical protein CIW69_04655 [Enterobacter cloacae]